MQAHYHTSVNYMLQYLTRTTLGDGASVWKAGCLYALSPLPFLARTRPAIPCVSLDALDTMASSMLVCNGIKKREFWFSGADMRTQNEHVSEVSGQALVPLS